MNEVEFSKNIKHILDKGLTEVDAATLDKLRSARLNALAHLPATTTQLATNVSGGTLTFTQVGRKPLFWMMILSTVIVLTASYHFLWDDDIADDIGEIDARLLTGELPIHAFLDKDFQSWVNEQQP